MALRSDQPTNTSDVRADVGPRTHQPVGPRLVALDIDGTLVATGSNVPQVTIEAVGEVVDVGHHIVLATGRSLVGVLPVVRQLGLRAGWIVASNGAVTARIRDGRATLEETTMFDPAQVLGLTCGAIPDALLAVEVVGKGYLVNRRFPEGLLNGRQRIVPPESDLWAGPTTRLVIHAPNAAEIAHELRRFDVTVNVASDDWLDVTPPGLSKASALELVRERVLVAQENTVAIGDGTNDIEALRWAAYSVAMGHAPAALKALADEVTGTIEADGVVPVLRSLVQVALPR